MAKRVSSIGTFTLAAVSCLVAVGAAAAIVLYQHVQTRFVPPGVAARELAIARASASFAGNRPLLEVTGQLQVLVHRNLSNGRRRFAALHTLDYDPHAGKLMRADLPEWLLRLASADGRIRLANLDIIQKDSERITLEDLERHGPGVILDFNVPQGRQVVIWIE